MSTKFQVVRVTGEGEQLAIEANVPDSIAAKGYAGKKGPEAVHEYLKDNMYGPADIRLAESSRRLLDAMGFVRQLPADKQSYVNFVVKQVLDMIYGRQPMASVPTDAIEADKQAIEEAKAAERAAAAAEGREPEPWANKDNVIAFPQREIVEPDPA